MKAWVMICVVWVTPVMWAAEDIVIADFEGEAYPAGWKVEGEAFGTGPARGTLANQQRVWGFEGKGLVNSYLKGDGTTGTLTSPEFEVRRKYVNLLVGGGADPVDTRVELVVDGRVVRSACGRDEERLMGVTWEVPELAGKRAVIRIVDRARGGWGHINVDHIVQSDQLKAAVISPPVPEIVADKLYEETFRPQFHFTSKKGWLNDPNGLVFYKGTYHLFFQHNPEGRQWGNMTWGHAVSKDLMRWEQRPHAIERDELGDIWSGSAVVDWNDTAGFGREAIVCVYTSAGGQGPMNKGKPFTQSIAYSTDGGRTFKKYEKNPVLGNVAGDNRDPKVFWHDATKKWVMALYVPVKEGEKTVQTIQFFGSPNLKEWTYLSRVDDFFECPDLFELAVDGDGSKKKWVLFGADGQYLIGRFDGTAFVKEAGKLRSDWGKNFYAAQTYSDAPGGRRILIGWMREGRYPGMPFNQQMGIPVELSLRTTADGVRMCKWPVKEVETLYGWQRTLSREMNVLHEGTYDVEAEVDFSAVESAALRVQGHVINWVKQGKLTMMGTVVDVKPPAGAKGRIRVLVDRTSVEVFVNGGEVTVSQCFLPMRESPLVMAYSESDGGQTVTWRVREMKSAWKRD